MHENFTVPALIKEIYDFLRQADELNDLFRRLENGENVQDQIDNFETYSSIIADIDAGFGNEEATYLLTKKMIELVLVQFKLKIKFRMLNNVVIKMESYCTS
jgi:isocitrate lyase